MLTAASILDEAEQTVGVTDTDVGVRGNLERLLDSMNQDFPLSAGGEARTRGMLLMDAVNRLEGLKWVAEHPEIAHEPIEAPVFLMGLPRSGTTYFQYLFDCDYRFRLIRTWESMMPFPPPGYDPPSVERRRTAWREMQQGRVHFEGFEALHLYDEDGPDECHAFLEQSYGAAGLHNLYRVPAFFDWLMDELDFVQIYRIHRRQLQLLQWRSERKPWALKYPNHVIALNEILQVYPDARFVMTHRDPVQVVPSIAKMTFHLRRMRAAGPVDKKQVGRDMVHFIQRHIERILAFDRGPYGARVIHVDYYALVADPVREMREIHHRLGIDTPDEVATRVADWHAANPQNARGRNDYGLEEYGLNEGELCERFDEYMRRFDIPREAEGLARVQSRRGNRYH
jgi:hypothetical protein